ncbi:MAG: site-specific integrase [Actinobacteria bacterium]|nr:site-specific integrase [Actinomycetota bacterium]MBU4219919.1 site-specific integrase [Actinomycetota bacterium]MBU4403928.1 site-specific integrase [Actinomycetota bacterium]
MKKGKSNTLGATLRDFFSYHLPQLRGMSPHTILSYRDSLKLLLLFISEHKGVSVSDLAVEDIGVPEVLAFLDHLENDRHNVVGTRNIRLSAIHSFFRYLAGVHPEHLDQSQRILSIPFKRSSTNSVEYLEFDEIMALLGSIDRSKPDGRRDYALLALMFNTGARVTEIVELKAIDLELTKPSSVRISGKGRKERICPIWTQTAQVLREYLEERGIDTREPVTVFTNHVGGPLTRFGVRYILAKYLKKASDEQPSLAKKHLHPHSIRHSTAVHLLKSGVDLSTIANWLGHSSVNTTNKYAVMDLEMKREALAKAKPFDVGAGKTSWSRDPGILAWLESL